MVRFSCFQGHVHSPKHKKTAQLSSEAMHKTLEDSSQNQASRNLSYLTTENKPCLKEEEYIHNNIADHVTDDYSPTERDCRSEEMEGKYSTDCDSVVHKTAQIKKSQSLGSGLNWEGRIDGSEDEIEQGFSDGGSASRSGLVVQDGTNTPGLSLSDQFQEPLPSDSVQVDSDVAKNVSIFSIGDPQQTEKESADKDDICLSGAVDSGDLTPLIQPGMIKSSSLPRLGSPNRCSSSPLRPSRSAEDLNTVDSEKKGMMHERGGQIQYQQKEISMLSDDKNHGESPVDETEETYNYVASAKDWIIPVSDRGNMEESIKGETSFNHLDEIPTHDFRLKRIEDWVINLQHCDPLEETEESSPCYDQELSKGNALLEEPTSSKSEVKVYPGMEAAKRYISSLNASATAAQMTNLGLVVIPFLSAFGSLKALNLSGNAIVRIAAGALPRGLHILNLSKNNISTIEGLRDLTRLRVLDLSYNRILRIGHGLAACSSLKELYLAGNKISEVEGLHRLLKLNVLDLRFNKISTTKCLGQLAANYNSLHALSLEGNPAQKNVGDEQLKKYMQSLLPNLTYYNRQSIKVGTVKDGSDRSARLSIGSHQIDRGLRSEAKTMRKGTHGIVAQKVPSLSSHGKKGQAIASPKTTRGRHGHGGGLPPSGMKTIAQGNQFPGVSNKLLSLRNELSIPRSRSEGNLGAT